PAARRRGTVPEGSVDGEALRLRDCGARLFGRNPDPRRLRLRGGLSRRAHLARRARLPDLRGRERYPAAGHRTRIGGRLMTAIRSQLDIRSEEFRANAARMQGLVDDLREKVEKVSLGGDEAARAKHVARGKLLPRERVRTLLDPGSPFLEIGQLAA